MIVCIGIDLAWSPRNLSGAAVITGESTGGTLSDVSILLSDGEIIAYIEHHAADRPTLIAVDAPLTVPNLTGRRRAEDELGHVFAHYQAGAHSANRQLLAFDGIVRGEALVEALEARGFVHAPAIASGNAVRQITEVYPHAAMIRLFGLSRTLKYKARPRRSRVERLAAWQSYQQHMRNLSRADPALHGQESLLAQDVSFLRGSGLKAYEDRVDALLCAYIALYAFRWGADRCRTFGTLESGYIFTPVPENLLPDIVPEC